jgi:5'-3' exonuclease
MGLPGFFAWLLKKSKTNKEHKMITNNLQIRPKRLYIDANCAFHPQCFKLLEHIDKSISTDKLENMMIKRIINYIDYLVSFVNPEELVYISVDGVAPKAKIKQQRMRRFKSVEESQVREELKKKHNKKSIIKWSNTVITPATEFMETLHKELDNHFRNKKDKIKYIYSSYHTNGEGEHKILKHIKLSQDNGPYVIYGLDADLFFLAMASQKKNIFLLRESEQFDGNKKIKNHLINPITDVIEDLKYISVDITKEMYNEQIIEIMRVTQIQTNGVCVYDENKFNKDNFCNDFIVLCFLLGNDFLPHLPSIDIKKGGLDILLECYSNVYINSGEHIVEIINNKIKINNKIFLEIISEIGIREHCYFTEILQKSKYNNSKKRCHESDPYTKELWEIENMKNIKINDPVKLGSDSEEFWKFRYYNHYFNANEYMNELIGDMCKNYLDGICWVTKYYFESCNDWRWQYEYSHAPFISDISEYFHDTEYDMNKIIFEVKPPILPVVQLMCVLPPLCCDLLPISYRKLINDPHSPIIDMFPLKVEIDMLNKDQLWQCIPLVPPLDEKRILECIEKNNLKLTKEEEIRNKVIDDYKY